MAYPTVSAPYGFKPINRVDGMAYAGAIRQIPVTQADPIFNGDTVVMAVGGVVERAETTATGPVLGVLVGCQYVNSMGQTIQGQYYPGTNAATNAVAYVVDDPMAAFKVVATDDQGVITPVGQGIVGTNVPGVVGVGDATTGNSGSSVDVGNADSTDTLPFRVIAGVPETATATGFVELIVKINDHQYNNTTGNALPTP